jgi:hypothetical protein
MSDTEFEIVYKRPTIKFGLEGSEQAWTRRRRTTEGHKTMSDTTRLKIQLHIPGMEYYFWHGIDLSKATIDPEEIWRTILTLKPWIEESCAMAKRQLQARAEAPQAEKEMSDELYHITTFPAGTEISEHLDDAGRKIGYTFVQPDGVIESVKLSYAGVTLIETRVDADNFSIAVRPQALTASPQAD